MTTHHIKHLIAATALSIATLLSTATNAAAVAQAGCSESSNPSVSPSEFPPKVLGLSVDEAAERLLEMGYNCTVENDDFTKVDERAVVVVMQQEVRTRPDPDVTVPVVALTRGVKMPDLVGKTLAAAQQIAAQRAIEVRTSPTEAAANWTVERQRPAAGKYMNFGAVAGLTLKEPVPPEPVPVPDLIGHTEDEAAVMVKGAGLVYAERIVKDGKRPGRVVSQQPQPGELVDRASTVTADIRRVVAPVTPSPVVPPTTGVPPSTVVPPPTTRTAPVRTVVPDVVGRVESTARQMIEVARLRFDSRVLHPGNAAGIVMSQSPPAGTEVDVGTVVTVDLTREQILIPAADESDWPSWLVPLVLATAVLAAGTISRLRQRPHKDPKPPMPHIHAAGRLTPGVPRIHESGPAHRIRVSGRLDRGRQYLQEKSDEHQ